MERKVVMAPTDYALVKEYLTTKPLPYKETEPILAALKRAVLMDIETNEPKGDKSDKESPKGDRARERKRVEAKKQALPK